MDSGQLSPLCSQTRGLRTVPCRCRWPHVQCAAPGPNPGSIESIVRGPNPPTHSLSLASHGPACCWLPGKYCTGPPPPPPPARPRKSVVNCLCGGGSWSRVYLLNHPFSYHLLCSSHLTINPASDRGSLPPPLEFCVKDPVGRGVAGSAMCPAVLCVAMRVPSLHVPRIVAL